MATIGLSPAALELMQSFSIDFKDFSKARTRYDKVRSELSAKITAEDAEAAEVVAVTKETLQRLNDAWEEYLTLVQIYFRKVSSAVVEDLFNKTRGSATAAERAEKLNELCAIGEKWYVRNENYFEFQEPEKLVVLVEEALDSSSRVMRLLGVQLARIWAANVMFTRRLFSGRGCGLIGLCLDRENATELEYALNMCTRIIELYEIDPKAYPVFPYGWMYRIAALLDVQDQMPNLLPKRRSQAVRIAIKLLRRFPAMATAASLHTLLLRYCIQKGGATLDEIQSVLHVVLDMFDSSETRQYIRSNDLDVLYSPFLYYTEKSNEDSIALMNGAKDVLAMVLRTWVGILWTSSETKGLRAVIDILHLPGDLDRKMILLTLFNKVLCNLAPHRGLTTMETWQGVEGNKRKASAALGERDTMDVRDSFTSIDSPHVLGDSTKSLTSLDAMLGELGEGQEDFVPTTKAIGYHVLDPLLGRALLVFSYYGLPLALVSIIQNGNSSRVLTMAASSLLQDLLVLMDTVLPVHPVKRLHTALNRAVGRLAQEGDLSFGGGLSSRLFQHCQNTNDAKISAVNAGAGVVEGGRVNALSAAAITTYGLGSIELDDAAFESLVRETGVEQASGFQGWNYDLLLLLIQGALRSMPRFRWVLNETKFFHKLIAFYHPSLNSQVRTFISLRSEECTPHLCMFGLALLDLFFSTREGAQVLERFEFTKSLTLCLEEVINGTPYVLNRQRLDTRVGQTLLRMVGRYSLSANGLMAMKENNMFGIINSMFEKLSGERVTSPSKNDTLQDVCHLLLQYLYIGAVPNYGVCEEIRQAFRSALRNDANPIRLCATVQLRKALWRDLSTSMRWGIETLVQALHDDFYSVVESAFKLLLSICLCSDEALDYLISLSPTVLMESDVIRDHAKQLNLNTLLYCIVGRPSGFRFLQCYGWVEQELRRWEETESANHVINVERMQSGEHVELSVDFREGISGRWRQRHNRTVSDPLFSLYRTAVLSNSSSSSIPPTTAATPGFFPSHFAAVLCKSNEGCTLFKHSNLWQRSIKRILDQPLPPDIVYDDSNDINSDSSDDDDDDDDDYENKQKALTEENPAFWGRLSGKAGNISIAAAAKSSAEARALRLSREGRLPSSYAAKLISASRGYKSASQSYMLECVGSVSELKDAILCVCHVASSDAGLGLVRAVPGVLKRLMALARFASTVSVRSICLVGNCLMARSRRGAEQLTGATHYVLSERNAYTSVDGVPYSVAFAHIKPSKWTSIGRRTHPVKASAAHFAHIQWELLEENINENNNNNNNNNKESEKERKHERVGSGIMLMRGNNGVFANSTQARRIWDQVCALSNPVSREGAKKKLYNMMKYQPQVFVESQLRGLLIDAAQTFRMRHAERKFIADLLETAPLAKPTATNRRAMVVVPP